MTPAAARSAFQLEHPWGDDAFLGGRRDVRGCAIPGCFFFGARRLGRRRENTPARQPKASSAATTTQVRRAVIVSVLHHHRANSHQYEGKAPPTLQISY